MCFTAVANEIMWWQKYKVKFMGFLNRECYSEIMGAEGKQFTM